MLGAGALIARAATAVVAVDVAVRAEHLGFAVAQALGPDEWVERETGCGHRLSRASDPDHEHCTVDCDNGNGKRRASTQPAM